MRPETPPGSEPTRPELAEGPITARPVEEPVGDPPSARVSRRGLLGVAGAGAVGVGLGVGGTVLATRAGQTSAPAAEAPLGNRVYPFYGERQAGIATPMQDRLHFAAFDVTATSRAELVGLLEDWTAAAARMTAAEPAGEMGPTSGPYDAPPDDTGEAIGLPASSLTLTFGFGPSLFRDGGKDRFGLAARQPDALRRLPHFPADNLDPARSDGDLCVQACADDPQVAVHAIRNLARIGFGRVAMRWSQLGFGRTSSTSTSQTTPRNLFGFKDGSHNLKVEQPEELDSHVWVRRGADPKADWLAGGSYLVARRINMTIETWDRQSLREQERVIGRTKAEGAPLSGGGEFDQPNFSLTGRADEPLIAPDAHVALVHPTANGGARMLRRGYNFVDGSNGLGRLDAGLFFLAFVVDPRTHFIPIQTKIGVGDAMSEYLQHTGSALFAVPPGVREGEFVGQALFS
jgi:deferrochelatase/peroxidase EfeB